MYMIASRGTSIKQLFVCAPTEVDFARRGHAAGLRPTPLPERCVEREGEETERAYIVYIHIDDITR